MATHSLKQAGTEARAGQIFDTGPRALRIELRDLRYFVGLADELHFGRAAARLYITQPGLSQAIARLEQTLDVKLFTRTQRNVELTAAGVELVDRARRLLADHDAAISRVRSVGRGEAAVIHLGVAALSEPLVRPAVKAFQHDHPRVPLDHSVMVSERLLDQLQIGGLDAAIVHQVPALASVENIDSELLRRGPLAVVVGPATWLARRETVTLDQLSQETFLVVPRSIAPSAREGLKLMCRTFGGFDANVRESTAFVTYVPHDDCAIAKGEAVAVMADDSARAIAEAQGLAVVLLQPPPEYMVALARRRGEPETHVQRFVDYLRAYRDDHGWSGPPHEDMDRAQKAGVARHDCPQEESAAIGCPAVSMGSIRECSNQDLGVILTIINAAAEAYRGVIPAELWYEPYMPADELDREIAAGVEFWCYEAGGALLGVTGFQRVRDVDLIRHAYVLPTAQRHGAGGALLEHLKRLSTRQLLVGTWAAAYWAIRFYQRHGFVLVPESQTAALIRSYWSIPDRQLEASVILASPPPDVA